jgi:hypothetical protein
MSFSLWMRGEIVWAYYIEFVSWFLLIDLCCPSLSNKISIMKTSVLVLLQRNVNVGKTKITLFLFLKHKGVNVLFLENTVQSSAKLKLKISRFYVFEFTSFLRNTVRTGNLYFQFAKALGGKSLEIPRNCSNSGRVFGNTQDVCRGLS